jgi:hypothetical protein
MEDEQPLSLYLFTYHVDAKIIRGVTLLSQMVLYVPAMNFLLIFFFPCMLVCLWSNRCLNIHIVKYICLILYLVSPK